MTPQDARPAGDQRAIVRCARAAVRLERAAGWLAAQGAASEVVVVGHGLDAASELCRAALERSPAQASFGWHRTTLLRLATALAGPEMAASGSTPASHLVLEALAARVVFGLAASAEGRRTLGRFAAIADRPGLPRALAATFLELRMAAVGPDALSSHASAPARELAPLYLAFQEARRAAGLVDRAEVLAIATRRARDAAAHPLLGLPLLLLDVPLASRVELHLAAALASRARTALAVVPRGEEPRSAALAAALGVTIEDAPTGEPGAPATAVANVQTYLFASAAPSGAEEPDAVTVLSAPGESRECVELARVLHREAERGVPFDRMAVLLRAPGAYRAHLGEALRRAGIPAWFERGSRRPDPTGRAMLALLACVAEGLSARRFAEYLSLGQVPELAGDGKPSAVAPEAPRWVPPEDELLPARVAREEEEREDLEPPPPSGATPLPDDPEAVPAVSGNLRAPRRWERLIVDAAVIGGSNRWQRRLRGLAGELADKLATAQATGGDGVESIRRDMAMLGNLEAFALPLLDELATLPERARWGEWLEALAALAPRALRDPTRVLSVLAELAPMAEVGPVELGEVRLVLAERLGEVVSRPTGRRAGRVLVAPVEAARGLSFDVVLVPGLAERVFPQKVGEEPILRDADRLALGLRTNADRVADERLLLHLAVGATRGRLVLSYPRVDLDQARPRVPSFYGLEVVRAAEGQLPGFDVLMRNAERAQGGASRIGWPAPQRPLDAIDAAEHDLALLADIFTRPEPETVGTARYLLSTNVHLARALRFRARRWLKNAWKSSDGLVDPIPEARAALARHQLDSRSFSPTALQNYAACPYRFFLQAIHRLAPREAPEAIEELGPLERGSLVHAVQFELLSALRDDDLLPVTPQRLGEAQRRLDAVLKRVATSAEERLAPAIQRVWDDAIVSVGADLREWLRRTAETPEWSPLRFELSFGLGAQRAADPGSRAEAVPLDCGIQLRGSIDLVERRPGDSEDAGGGNLRATDHKTGRRRGETGMVIGGGEMLQPVLYALALEKLFRGSTVESGRLYYATATGGFSEVDIPLDSHAREGAEALADALRGALAEPFLPAAPRQGACKYCDYAVVCGPYEEQRTGRKPKARLARLKKLREMP